jgi:mannosyltransferase OCH1-like enzyme
MRLLILHKIGGMYVDFDYECLRNIEPLLIENKNCCIATEPETRCVMYSVPNLLNSALIATVPQNPYLEKIIDKIFSDSTLQYDQRDKILCVLKTTGLKCAGFSAKPYDCQKWRMICNGISYKN